MARTNQSSGLLPIFMLIGLVFLVVAVYMGSQSQQAADDHRQTVESQHDQAQDEVDDIQLDSNSQPPSPDRPAANQ